MSRDDARVDTGPSSGLEPSALAGRRAVVMGLGRFGGGVGAVRYLLACGARVVGTDLRSAAELPEALRELDGLDVELILGEHRERDFEEADLVVVNPAVPPSAPLLNRARAAGTRLASEIELFTAAAPCRLVGVTGTQGKSSTTAFTAELLRRTGLDARAGGNLGGSLLGALAELRPAGVVVLELSSYQLEGLGRPVALARPFEAVAVTNVEADHLERHGTLASYAAAKRRILELLDPTHGVAVLPAGPGPCADWDLPAGDAVARAHRTVRFDPNATPDELVVSCAGESSTVPGPAALGLPAFQAANLRAALALCDALGVGRAAVAALGVAPLTAPAHRLERLADLGGASVWDNGVSTTPDSTAAALRSLDAPVVLIAGGRAKNLPTQVLADAARGTVRAAFTFGDAAVAFAELLATGGVATTACPTLEAAVDAAAAALRPGDALLFSPACASFDTHANFRERALAFRAALERARARSEERGGALSSPTDPA
ncbi:UDP-N-acetylmuramoyl-L-alanine--D-glutamate ligase [Rohdeia mirabilis]|uniref:UDP-N-acetylmuramoyl-L-alanine--D-glutamate ligase n=1 Tax=Rohdeia mirabilis TaxID=2528008 RepID=UPI003AF38C09